MTGDCHAGICGSPGVRFPRATRPDVVGVVFPRAGPGGGDPQEGQRVGSECSAYRTSSTGSRKRRRRWRWSPVWSLCSTRTPTAIVPGARPWTRSRSAESGVLGQDWVVDLDIRAFFDSVPWDLMLRAVARHTDQKWVVLYVERWLKAPMQRPDGTLVPRVKGTPQGSPISPVLANLFCMCVLIGK